MDDFPQISIDRSAPTSLTEQLVQGLREAMVAGQMRPGESVPATRAFSAALGVSRSVVVAAYEQLVGEAFFESRQGARTRVSSALPDWLIGQEWPRQERGRAAVAGHPEAQQDAAAPINLVAGRPFAPPVAPREWARALTRAAHVPWSSDSVPPLGDSKLREAFAAHARVSRGLACTAEDIVVTSGTSEALLLVCLALREMRGGEAPRIAVEDPGYPEGTAALRRAGAVIHPLEVGRDGTSVDGVAKLHRLVRLDAVMLTPSHQYPLGGRIPANERLALLDWAGRHGVTIIEDDYDSEFRHGGTALPAMASLDPHGQTIYIATLNKVLSPSLRCGMILLPHGNVPLREALIDTRIVLGASVSAHTQIALADVMASGDFRRTVARNKREYRHRRDLVLRVLGEGGVPVTGGEGGLHVLIPLPSTVSEAELVRDLWEQGVVLEGLRAFSLIGRADEGLVIGYGAETIPRLTVALERVCAAYAEKLEQGAASGGPAE